ncbi:post-GPI attachment to proteins factor 2-like isoform X2 [Thalassophryne amazonica]|uniref:post-GPI attachment to proteins factor 2-like isoform X2 n=1 Tax=Thalassophryne amazonica TaxID=390379 RepID=UPI00147202D0|nr:post-GPI attachment to proteins factor 2-like isoform X2 [Thalassophryne amazonica]
MLQGSNILGHERPMVIRLSFSTCVLATVCLPLLGLITCVFISSVFHFEDSTGTHCQVAETTLSCLSLVFSLSENLGLLLLTYVSSSETYFVHKEGFVLFIISSLIYMLITCHLWKSIKKYSFSPEDAKSHHWKVRFLVLNVSFCVFAGFFYWKHNMYCESGSYTFFALFEYLVVFSNMSFHLTAVWDFKSREVMVISASEHKDF